MKDVKLIRKSLDWLFKTKDGKLVLIQKPNWPLLMVIAFWIGSLFVSSQPYNNLLAMLYRLMLLYWAAQEIKTGVNKFRVILGTIVFVLILSGFSHQLL